VTDAEKALSREYGTGAPPLCVECGNPARNVHYCGMCGKSCCLVCGEAHMDHCHPEDDK
jgi:hypothetical protein